MRADASRPTIKPLLVVLLGAIAGVGSFECAPIARADDTTLETLDLADRDRIVEVIQVLNDTPLQAGTLVVSGEQVTQRPIIKTEELFFRNDSRLIVDTLDVPFAVIAAKQLRVEERHRWAMIGRKPELVSMSGRPGQPGSPGFNGLGETNRRGDDGGPGARGGDGEPGGTVRLPDVFIVVGALGDDNGALPVGVLDLALWFPGAAGGRGGDGGWGGDGGRAGDAKIGATSIIQCMDRAGPGGRGGDAGPGGNGGDGGAGGRGGNIYIIAESGLLEAFRFVRVNNDGGPGGEPGNGGPPGRPGRGGEGAGRNGFCPSSPDGPPGASAEQGRNGVPGMRGSGGEFRLIPIDRIPPINWTPGDS